VINEKETGAQTLENIELISTGSTNSDAFKQRGCIIAGSFQYYLQQENNSGDNMNKWYLTSKVKDPNKSNDSDNSDNSGNSSDIGNNSNSSYKETRIFRPEAGSYASNLVAPIPSSTCA
jgi:autotransporter family porin